MKTLIAAYLLILATFGPFLYIGMMLGEWLKDGKANLPLMSVLYVVRYFFRTSVKGGNLTGNPKDWQIAGLTIIDFILPFVFLYLLIK